MVPDVVAFSQLKFVVKESVLLLKKQKFSFLIIIVFAFSLYFFCFESFQFLKS